MNSNLIVTGIPRSGTSFLTSTLHKFENCVAINEPEEIFAHLDDTGAPWGMASYYHSLRRAIIDRRPIVNKLVDGKVIEDTAVVDSEQSYIPHIDGDSFLLATKNTLGYLARLRFLSEALPDALFVACVRNPYSTIASWKETFPHLREADPRGFRKGFLGDPLMRPPARHRLQAMAEEVSPEVRRALFWNHLALLILEDRPVFSGIFRYEEFSLDPGSQLSSFLGSVNGAAPHRPNVTIERSSPRMQRARNLGPRDIDAVRSICTDTAALFGYDLGQMPSPNS